MHTVIRWNKTMLKLGLMFWFRVRYFGFINSVDNLNLTIIKSFECKPFVRVNDEGQRNSLWWPICIINSDHQTNLSCYNLPWCSTTVSWETNPFLFLVFLAQECHMAQDAITCLIFIHFFWNFHNQKVIERSAHWQHKIVALSNISLHLPPQQLLELFVFVLFWFR